ncbi:Glyoxylase, beta-lactamase superfamily II [Planifilum fulgidum]|jgi:glyoxylase-like metal-dependent hydrolase (beta-lactamase superfamily II)|uniref:Glyoxylase, beta-lactamase superfamily II n=1 Tax=Planifilum fulgidum TaxID=201973 RepID=A0A1I2NZ04_9BACL|nr:MBL fold metallo-hydrolase [Planifilum fulgidum]SFG06706.1 Glyoxylase, beta-lactamase superfamily II [Planifilum fulgidum]
MNHWEDLTEVPLPLPFPLKIIKAYVIRGSGGYTLIDAGLNCEEDWALWEQTRKEMGWRWDEVEKIVLTHYHPDHYGLAGKLQQVTGAPVLMSRTDAEQARFFWDEGSDAPEVLADLYARHGLSEDWTSRIPGHLRDFRKWVEPHPEPTFIQGGETIRLGDREYRILHTPGHADGHLSFYDPERKWLIGGDFLLPKITPNISLWPGCDPNPLKSYLTTLDKMESLPVKRVFPAHGPVFDTYRERIAELKEHHRVRLERMKDLLKAGPLPAAEICFEIFGRNLSIHNLRFALSETLAHLEYLRHRGEVTLEERGKTLLYALNP